MKKQTMKNFILTSFVMLLSMMGFTQTPYSFEVQLGCKSSSLQQTYINIYDDAGVLLEQTVVNFSGNSITSAAPTTYIDFTNAQVVPDPSGSTQSYAVLGAELVAGNFTVCHFGTYLCGTYSRNYGISCEDFNQVPQATVELGPNDGEATITDSEGNEAIVCLADCPDLSVDPTTGEATFTIGGVEYTTSSSTFVPEFTTGTLIGTHSAGGIDVEVYAPPSTDVLTSISQVQDSMVYIDENGDRVAICNSSIIQDHSGATINLDCAPTLFNEDISLTDDTNPEEGIGVSGARYSDGPILNHTTETRKGVLLSQNSTVDGDRDVVAIATRNGLVTGNTRWSARIANLDGEITTGIGQIIAGGLSSDITGGNYNGSYSNSGSLISATGIANAQIATRGSTISTTGFANLNGGGTSNNLSSGSSGVLLGGLNSIYHNNTSISTLITGVNAEINNTVQGFSLSTLNGLIIGSNNSGIIGSTSATGLTTPSTATDFTKRTTVENAQNSSIINSTSSYIGENSTSGVNYSQESGITDLANKANGKNVITGSVTSKIDGSGAAGIYSSVGSEIDQGNTVAIIGASNAKIPASGSAANGGRLLHVVIAGGENIQAASIQGNGNTADNYFYAPHLVIDAGDFIHQVPASTTDTKGVFGEIFIAPDASYIYVKAPDGSGWKRVALSNF